MVYNETTGLWDIRNLSSGYTTNIIFGGSGYVPVPGDYDGDGISDLGIYRYASGYWYARRLADQQLAVFGGSYWAGPKLAMSGGFVSVAGDYDGDVKADGGIYQEATGLWIILPSGSLTPSGYVPVSGVFGSPGFVPVPADYTGEGMADAAVYDEVTGNWYIVAIDGTRVAWPVQHGGYGFSPVRL